MVRNKQAQLPPILIVAMGSSKSVLSVAAAVVAGPPLVPESAMGKVNDPCFTRIPHLETLHLQFILQCKEAFRMRIFKMRKSGLTP